jgi:hypothetical protein
LIAEALIIGAALITATIGYAGRPLAIVATFGSFFAAVVFVALSNFLILGFAPSPLGWLKVVVVLLLLVGCAVTLFPIWDVLARTAAR